MSSQGQDSNAISGQASTEKFNSGTERLLAQIEKFESSKETMSIYRDAESDLYKIVKAWHNALKGSGVLKPKYETADLPEDSEVIVKYVEPQTIMSEADKLDVAERKVDLGIWDLVKAAMYTEDKTREQVLDEYPELENMELVEPEIDEVEVDEETLEEGRA